MVQQRAFSTPTPLGPATSAPSAPYSPRTPVDSGLHKVPTPLSRSSTTQDERLGHSHSPTGALQRR